MLKSEVCAIVARQLNRPLNRVEALVQRVSEAGLLPMARGSSRPEMCSIELARIIICAVADNGLGNAAATVASFEALTTESGVSLSDVLDGIIRSDTDAPGDMALQLSPAAALLTVGGKQLLFGAGLQAGAAVRIVHVPGSVLQAIVREFNGKKNSTLKDAKSELNAARRCKADLEKQLVQVEGKLASSDEYDPRKVALRSHGRDIRDEISSLENRIKELEPTVLEAEAARAADIASRVPIIKDALSKLTEALDACIEAERVIEQHRVSFREARLPAFKKLPALAQPHAKKLVEQALRELEAIR